MSNMMDYKPVLSQIHGLIPQELMSELATSLLDVYHITRNGGHGSRTKVMEILLRLGLQPNDFKRPL